MAKGTTERFNEEELQRLENMLTIEQLSPDSLVQVIDTVKKKFQGDNPPCLERWSIPHVGLY